MKNDFVVRGDVTAIFINSPKYGSMETLVSTTKLEKIIRLNVRWRPWFDPKLRSFYVIGSLPRAKGESKYIRLHRFLTDAPSDMDVDHFNHDTLDNTDGNLRVIKRAHNSQNRKGANKNNKSGIRGVYWHGLTQKWGAEITVLGKKKYLGLFDDIRKAEIAVVDARSKHMPFSKEAAR